MNKSRLKIWEKLERGRIQGLPKFFEYPLLSQERIKLRTSHFVCTFLVSIGTKALYKFRDSRGRLRGLSKLFRAPIYWAHRAVVFAIARLSCIQPATVVSSTDIKRWQVKATFQKHNGR